MYGIREYVNIVTQNFVIIIDALNRLFSEEVDEDKRAKIQTLRDEFGETCAHHITSIEEYASQTREAIHDLADIVIGDPPDNQVLVDSATSLKDFSEDLKSVDSEMAILVSILGS